MMSSLMSCFNIPGFDLRLVALVVHHRLGQDDRRVLQVFVRSRLWYGVKLFLSLFLLLFFLVPGRLLSAKRGTRLIGISMLLRLRTELGAGRAEVAR